MQEKKQNYFIRLRVKNQAQAEKNTNQQPSANKSYAVSRLDVRRARSFKH